MTSRHLAIWARLLSYLLPQTTSGREAAVILSLKHEVLSITPAKALGVTVSQLLGEESAPARCSVVKKSERKLMARNGSVFGYSYETLAHHYPDKKMEPYILTIPAETEERSIFQHEGEEMLLVIEGTMRFLHGEDEYIVETGDCVYFDSSVPHFGRPADGRDVKCVMVIYGP